MNEREAYIALNLMEKIGPVTVRELVSVLGSAKAIFECSRDDLLSARGVGKELSAAILNQRQSTDWEGEMSRAAESGIKILAFPDEGYPETLRHIHDPPLALYVQGGLESRDRRAVAIVGTRHPTAYGRDQAEKFGYQLAQAGVTVISGLAEGIDTEAHEGALKAKGRTIAVIGSGLARLYPPSNQGLATRMAGQGAVLSEFPLARSPDKTTFPMRNRVVSGLCMGVLIVEAGQRSGALITANQALQQGRQVFAIPGRIDSPVSQGCHGLIKDGAQLVEDVEDILNAFDDLALPGLREKTRPERRVETSPEESRILSLLSGGASDVDLLIRESGLGAPAINSLLIGLEMKKLVRMCPGRMVEAISSRVNVQV